MFLDDFLGLGESTLFGNDEIDMSQYKAIPLAEGENPLDACLRLTIENEQNYTNIMSTIAMAELTYMEESGTNEVVYEAMDIKKIGSTILEWIKTQWEKLKGVFARAVENIRATVSTDKHLVKKYENEKANIKNPNVTVDKGVIVKGGISSLSNLVSEFVSAFDYGCANDVDGIKNVQMDNLNKDVVDRMAKSWKENKGVIINGSISKVCGASNISPSEFSGAVRRKVCETGSLTVNMENAYNSVKDGKEAIKGVKETFKKTEKAYKDMLSDAKKFKKDGKDKENRAAIAKFANVYSAQVKTKISYLNMLCRICIQIANADYQTNKRVLVKGLGGKNTSASKEKTTASESALICDII